MKQETIEKLKELAKYKVIEKEGQIIFVKREKKMEELIKKREEIETKKKGILNSIVLASAYNRELENKKINIQQYELQLQDVNKELKEINKLIGQYNVSKVEYPAEIKELLKKAKENYKLQVQNIKNEYLKIKEIKKNLGA